MSVSKRLRYEVLRRDNHTCQYCGETAPRVKLTVDHVKPTALGGTDEPANLVAACDECNAGKAASSPDGPLVEAVTADALRWAVAMQKAADLRRKEMEDEAEMLAWFETIWTRYWIGDDEPYEDREYLPRPQDWEQSVVRLLGAGLEMHFIAHAVETAMFNTTVAHGNRFRYACGICWREVSRRQEIAAQIIAADEAEG